MIETSLKIINDNVETHINYPNLIPILLNKLSKSVIDDEALGLDFVLKHCGFEDALHCYCITLGNGVEHTSMFKKLKKHREMLLNKVDGRRKDADEYFNNTKEERLIKHDKELLRLHNEKEKSESCALARYMKDLKRITEVYEAALKREDNYMNNTLTKAAEQRELESPKGFVNNDKLNNELGKKFMQLLEENHKKIPFGTHLKSKIVTIPSPQLSEDLFQPQFPKISDPFN